MKHFLLSFLLLLLASLLPAAAQNPATSESLSSLQFKQQLRQQYLHNDTAQAIITLYSTRQAGGVSWIVGSVTGGLTSALVGNRTSNATSAYYQPSEPSTGERLGVAALVITPIVGYGVAKLVRYSNAHLAQVLSAYAAGQPLPHSLRRKLKPRFFKTPIIPYQHVNVQPVK